MSDYYEVIEQQINKLNKLLVTAYEDWMMIKWKSEHNNYEEWDQINKKILIKEELEVWWFYLNTYKTLKGLAHPKLIRAQKKNKHFQTHFTRPVSPWHQNQTQALQKKIIIG